MKEKILTALKTLTSVLIAVMVTVAMVAVVWRVAAKFIPGMDGTALFWANEFQLLVLHWIVAFGMVVIYIKDLDIRITMILDRMSETGRKNMHRLFNLINTVVFFVVFFFGGKLAIMEWNTPTASLMWSRGLFVYMPYVLLGGFIAVFSAFELVKSFLKAKEA